MHKQKCPYCQTVTLNKKHGFTPKGKQRYRCSQCSKTWTVDAQPGNRIGRPGEIRIKDSFRPVHCNRPMQSKGRYWYCPICKKYQR